jgi:nucleotide-binding universal stress UspA family protein
MNTLEAGKRIALKNILFATDFSPCSTAALPYAVALARRYGATLYAAHVMPTKAETVFMWPENWSGIVEEENKRMEVYVAQLENQLKGLPHGVFTPRGRVPDVVVKSLEERQVDLLVLGTHGRTGVYKLLVGSVAEEIFRRACCPVLSVGPKLSVESQRQGEFHNVLFATDFTKESLSALPYAISLAEEDEAHLTLLHVVEQAAAGIIDLEVVTASLLRRLRELIPADAKPWCHAECLVEFGQVHASPADPILEVAEDKAADLIVLGVRPAHGDPGLVTHIASTTGRILDTGCLPRAYRARL